jgi:hypothetical protein
MRLPITVRTVYACKLTIRIYSNINNMVGSESKDILRFQIRNIEYSCLIVRR